MLKSPRKETPISSFRRFIPISFLCASILLPAHALAQQPGVEFAVEPAPGSQTAEGGGYFVIEAEPGQDVGQSISVRNESGRRLMLQLAAVDGVTGQLGGVSYGLPQDPPQRTGAWIELERTRVSLAAGGSSEVGFEITVPEDATAGEHIAGIAVWETGEDEQREEGQSVSVLVQTRRIVAVQVNTPGPKAAELVVTGVEPAARPDGLYLEIGIRNDGTAMTTGEGTIEILDQDFVVDFPVDTFVPATSIGYPLKWTDDPQEGTYEARVEIEYETGSAEWSGTFTVGDPVLAELQDRGVEVPGSLSLVPLGLAAGAAAAAGVGWWAWRRRSSSGRPVIETTPSSNPSPPAPGHRVASPETAPRNGSPPPPPPPPGPPL